MDLSTALSLLRPQLAAQFAHFPMYPSAFTDPTALLALSQQLVQPLPPAKRPHLSPISPVSTSSSSAHANASPPHSTTSSPQRKPPEPIPDEKKDQAYYERRRKNNDAAKRSRDSRRRKEEQVAARASFLEQENLQLRSQVAVLKNETAKLHLLLFSGAPQKIDPQPSDA